MRAGRVAVLCTGMVSAVVALAGCSGSSGAGPAPASATGCPLTVSDAWVKAVDSGMTAAFGTLRNSTGSAVTVDSASTSVSPQVQLHEVVTGSDGSATMQPKPGGFVVPSGGSTALTPGGDHVMLMDVTAPIRVGDDVTITLHTTGGAACTMTAAARTYTGAQETYVPGASSSPSPTDAMNGMDMSPSGSAMP